MQAQNLVIPTGLDHGADVGTPQVGNLVWPTYQIGRVSVRVAAGRAKSAFNSEQVPVCRMAAEAPQEGWSRGCRRAHVSFWFWLQSQLLPLVPKKKLLPPSRSPRKSWKPASTSNFPERAFRHLSDRPAPTLGLLRKGAVCRLISPDIASISQRSLWAVPQLSPIRAVDCNDRRQTRC